MSRDLEPNRQPIVGQEQLIEYFREGEKPRNRRGIGTETEKFVVRRKEGRMLSFEEPGGFGDIFQRLIDRFGWEATPPDEGHVVALVRNPGGAVTLEPGGQLELSGSVLNTVFETAQEFDSHLEELRQVADEDLAFVIWGMNPCVSLDDVPWMPKSRYKIMRSYLPNKGDLAHWMMKTTCTIQANYDYCSEEDAVDLVHTAVLASPIAGALFANSPIRECELTGYQSYRNYIWTRTDPDRTGVPSFMYTKDWGFEDYIDYVFNVPMFFIRRDDKYVDMAGHSFAEFVARGYEGYQANVGDFELHLSTVFPDVRLKKFVEVRSVDGGPRDAVLALPALWKGLLYDDDARAAVVELFEPLSEADHRALTATCYIQGIHGDSAYGPICEIAQNLVDIADGGLRRIAEEAGHPSEAPFLDPLRERLRLKRSWADELIDDFKELNCDLAALADKWAP